MLKRLSNQNLLACRIGSCASASTSSAAASPARRLFSEEVRNLLQRSPQVSPTKPAAALPPIPSYSDLKLHKMSLKRFCTRQGFHTETTASAESMKEFFTEPLATISSTLMDLDRPLPKVTPTQRYHATSSAPPPHEHRRIQVLQRLQTLVAPASTRRQTSWCPTRQPT